MKEKRKTETRGRRKAEKKRRKLGDEGPRCVYKNKTGNRWRREEKEKQRPLPVCPGAARKFFPPFTALLLLFLTLRVFLTNRSLPLSTSLLLLLSSLSFSPSLPPSQQSLLFPWRLCKEFQLGAPPTHPDHPPTPPHTPQLHTHHNE